MKITKKQIIKAIMTEPLRPGAWFNYKPHYGQFDELDAKTCKVCAVGAVLRNACGVIPTSTSTFKDSNNTMYDVLEGAVNFIRPVSPYDGKYKAIKSNEYLNKLSWVFENMCIQLKEDDDFELAQSLFSGAALKAVRLELSDFVRDEFPDEIEVDFGPGYVDEYFS